MPVTICPVALVSSCSKCPIVKVCPLKGVIGDWRPGGDAKGEDTAPAKRASKSKPAATSERGKPKRRAGKRGRR